LGKKGNKIMVNNGKIDSLLYKPLETSGNFMVSNRKIVLYIATSLDGYIARE